MYGVISYDAVVSYNGVICYWPVCNNYKSELWELFYLIACLK